MRNNWGKDFPCTSSIDLGCQRNRVGHLGVGIFVLMDAISHGPSLLHQVPASHYVVLRVISDHFIDEQSSH
jgi:hypothetical protein